MEFLDVLYLLLYPDTQAIPHPTPPVGGNRTHADHHNTALLIFWDLEVLMMWR
jgi:hypothetical protein